MIGDVMFGPIWQAIKSAFRDLPPPNPATGFCSDRLARNLGAAAWGFFLTLLAVQAWKVFA